MVADKLIWLEYVCHYSPVLKAAFNGPFANAQTNSYKLEEISPGAFRLFFQWIYSQKIEVPLERYLQRDPYIISILDNVDFSEWDNEDFAKLIQEFYLVQLWITADHLLMPTLQNVTMTVLISLQDTPPNQFYKRTYYEEWFPYLYEHTAPGSPLRHLIVDRNAYDVDWEHVSELDNYPQEMLFEMVKVYSAGLSYGAMDIDSEYESDDYSCISEEESNSDAEDEDDEDDIEGEREASALRADREAVEAQADNEGEDLNDDKEDWGRSDSEDEDDKLRRTKMRFMRTWRKYMVAEEG